MSELLKVNVNDHTEKKNGLTYLSWAWAWAEVLKVDAGATWDAVEFDGLPCRFMPDGSALVKTTVTIKGQTKVCWLPVMNHRNQAIKAPDAFAVNTALVRCLTKNISMFGLGLYIYAGEDLPEGEDAPEPVKAPIIPARPAVELDADTEAFLQEMAAQVTELCQQGKNVEARNLVLAAALDDEQHIGLANMLDSKTRSALKKAKELATTKE
jgi:hypothetical protein